MHYILGWVFLSTPMTPLKISISSRNSWKSYVPYESSLASDLITHFVNHVNIYYSSNGDYIEDLLS